MDEDGSFLTSNRFRKGRGSRKEMIHNMRRAWILCVIFLFSFGLKVFGEPSIYVDTSTGRITVRATRKQLEEIERMIPHFPLQTRQVQIKARVAELSEEAVEEFGASLEKITGVSVIPGPEGEGTTIKYGPETLAEVEEGKGALLINFYKLITGEEKFEAVLNMLVSEGKARVLSEPQVTTMSGEVAGMYVTSDVPYLSEIAYRIVNESEVPEYHYDYATVGIVLEVLPKIVGEGLIEMSIVPVVGDYEASVLGAELPIFKRQIAPTNITVRDGELIIIGGLAQEKKEKRQTGIPILSGLPIVGNIFKSYKDIKTMRNLLITVKPHIISSREIRGRTKRVFTFKYALAEEIALQTGEILSSEGMMQINPGEAPPNSLLVRDNENRIEVIQEILNKLGTFEQQRRQRVFQLATSSPQEARETLLLLLSPEGSIQIDKKKNSITVEDGAYQLMKIERIISSLEKHNEITQRKVFHLKYAKEEEIVPLLREFLTPQGKIEILKDSLLVLDNNWVIQRIAEEIEKLDTFEGQREIKVYPLEYVDAEELSRLEEFKRAFFSFVCDKATAKALPEKNALAITALKWRFPRINKLVESFDVYRPLKITCRLSYSLASSDIIEELKPLLSPQGQIEVDEKENSLFLRESEYRLRIIKQRLAELDVFERERKEERICLRYMTLVQAVSLIEAIKSPEARIRERDEKKNELLIEEASYPLQKIEGIISQMDTFDIQVEERTYTLSSTRAEDIKKALSIIRSILSEKGRLDFCNNKIVVIDSAYHQLQVKRAIEMINARPIN